MGLVRESLPNLIGGVSQQPFTLRASNQHERQVNAVSSPANGLRKRPNTEHITALGYDLSGAYLHTVVRDRFEKYIIVLLDGDLKVFDFQGNEKTIHFADGKDYLSVSNAPELSFSISTYNDYTLITNKEVTTRSLDSIATNPRLPEALVWIRAGNYDTTYTITVTKQDGSTLTASYTTDATDETTVQTAEIARQLSVNGGIEGVDGFNCHYGPNLSVLHIYHDAMDDFDVEVTASTDDAQIVAIKDEVQSFTSLPEVGVGDFQIAVIGTEGSEYDTYYLQFQGDPAALKKGVWKEILKPGLKDSFDPATMPHLLVRLPDGNFEFRQGDWASRDCGDDTTNPQPSFLGTTISDTFLHADRLCFIAGNALSMSRTGAYLNFGRSTATQLLASDPIDFQVSGKNVSAIREAVPFGGEVLLFSDYTQYVLSSDGPLSPSSITVSPLSEYPTDLRAMPALAGSSVFAATPNGTNEAITEFVLERSGLSQSLSIVPRDISQHVTSFIPSGVYGLTASPQNRMLVVLSGSDRSTLTVYQWYEGSNGGLSQAAWHEWSFPDGEVLYAKFIDAELFLVMNRKTYTTLERIRIDEGYTDPGFVWRVHLDRKVTAGDYAADYYPDQDRTRYLVPYAMENPDFQVIADGTGELPAGTIIPVVEKEGDYAVWVTGDTTGEGAVVGQRYTMETELSPLVLRERNTEANGIRATTSGRLQIRRMAINYADSGYFKVAVTPKGRTTYEYLFTGYTLNELDSPIGAAAIQTGVFRFPVTANNLGVSIVISNDSPLPSNLLNIEWEALYTARSRRYQ
jgi:hypothetical protein